MKEIKKPAETHQPKDKFEKNKTDYMEILYHNYCHRKWKRWFWKPDLWKSSCQKLYSEYEEHENQTLDITTQTEETDMKIEVKAAIKHKKVLFYGIK